MTRLAKYTQELCGPLEEETGVDTGFRRCGSITAALSDERREEIFHTAAMAARLRRRGRGVERFGVQGALRAPEHRRRHRRLWLPKDGQGDPANIALALANGARQNGARTVEGVRVTGIRR